MTVLQLILGIVLIIVSVVIVAVILLQEGRRSGISGAIAGGADTFFSKNKARSVDAKLGRWTKYIGIFFGILILAGAVIGYLAK